MAGNKNSGRRRAHGAWAVADKVGSGRGIRVYIDGQSLTDYFGKSGIPERLCYRVRRMRGHTPCFAVDVRAVDECSDNGGPA